MRKNRIYNLVRSGLKYHVSIYNSYITSARYNEGDRKFLRFSLSLSMYSSTGEGEITEFADNISKCWFRERGGGGEKKKNFYSSSMSVDLKQK